MEETLRALGELLLKALPTLFLVLLLHFYLKWMFFRPLEKVLDARYEATQGARQQAEAAMEQARIKTAEFETALRNARTEIYREQEEIRKKWRQEQAAGVSAARESARNQVRSARTAIAADAAATRLSLGAESEILADQIVRSILERRPN